MPLLAFILAASFTTAYAQKQFTIVIDAGHGGKDPGAKGAYSFEKTINLAVALKLGEKIEKQNEDVKVLYTRKKDVYLTVAERPEFANKAKADLFISVHTNSSTAAAASGVETFSLGVAKTKENLEVAMTENSVILLEDNYKQKYQGFDPKSVESYIMFEFMQDAHSNQSIHLASLVQNHFINSCNRKDRGVRQAGFLVLKNTAMPAILVELGFISNPEEEKYLNSKEGQEALADAIYAAFIDYKTEFDKKSVPPANNNTAPNTVKNNTTPAKNGSAKAEEKATETVTTETKTYAKGQKVYKIQILTEKKLLQPNNARFKGVPDVSYYEENGVYKYTYGETTDKAESQKLLREARQNFAGAFIVTFVDGKRQK
jgi:N-acetylmuramoyl-L-alanine amidase